MLLLPAGALSLLPLTGCGQGELPTRSDPVECLEPRSELNGRVCTSRIETALSEAPVTTASRSSLSRSASLARAGWRNSLRAPGSPTLAEGPPDQRIEDER